MVNLEELYISHNGIEEIEGLDNLVSQTNGTRFQICLVIRQVLDSPVTSDRAVLVRAQAGIGSVLDNFIYFLATFSMLLM